MTEEIIERLEEYLGSEEFEYEAENCMEELDESGEGINAVLPLLRFLERHPMADISMTSAVVRFTAEVMRTFSWTPFVADLQCIL